MPLYIRSVSPDVTEFGKHTEFIVKLKWLFNPGNVLMCQTFRSSLQLFYIEMSQTINGHMENVKNNSCYTTYGSTILTLACFLFDGVW